jgi:hypothetical protein
MAWGVEAKMPSTGNEASTAALPWVVIRQDGNGNRYRVGRYATREEAQRVGDALDSRGHKQLYWTEVLSPEGRANPYLLRDFEQGARRAQLEAVREKTPPSLETSTAATDDEYTIAPQDLTDRRLQWGRPLFEALAHVLPADSRERWAEEWTAEWVDLGERRLRTRVAFLMRVALRSLPSIAWTLRLSARRQSAR